MLHRSVWSGRETTKQHRDALRGIIPLCGDTWRERLLRTIAHAASCCMSEGPPVGKQQERAKSASLLARYGMNAGKRALSKPHD